MKWDHEKYWDSVDRVSKFKIGNRNYLFESERIALERLKGEKLSVIDLGCGGGAFLDFSSNYIEIKSYKGVDLSKKSIEVANQKIQELGLRGVKFLVASVFDDKIIKKEDLIWSTGLVQHVETPDIFVELMLSKANRYAAFDLKVSPDISYGFLTSTITQNSGASAPYNIFSSKMVFDILFKFPNLTYDIHTHKIEPNAVFLSPAEIKTIYSVGILASKS